MPDTNAVIETRGLCKNFRVSGENSLIARTFPAVRDVSLTIRRGETFGIVGESGCGKSTVARLMMCIEKPTAGEIWFEGTRVDNLPEGKRRALRPKFQMVFQDSGSSLNPRKTVGAQIREPMLHHKIVPADQAEKRARELLDTVGLPEAMYSRYPHELSGGQRQRVCIARALSLNPDLVVLDEPVSALDVSVQAQILNLLRELQARLGLTCVFIGHGLGAVHYISHRIAVMYMGRVIETGDSEELFNHPAHPYTRALLDAAPSADPALRDRDRVALVGEVGEAVPAGACSLFPRCPYATEECLKFENKLIEVPGRAGHRSACLRGMAEMGTAGQIGI